MDLFCASGVQMDARKRLERIHPMAKNLDQKHLTMYGNATRELARLVSDV